uniref:Retroviral polymerase SH3-like domain-containing protein n=1 Tax=Strigamia maritima TaxID=126957 RepID=T1JNI4_STRMM
MDKFLTSYLLIHSHFTILIKAMLYHFLIGINALSLTVQKFQIEFCPFQGQSFLISQVFWKLFGGSRLLGHPVYSPHMNGVAERFNRSAIEALRATIVDDNLDRVWWAEVLMAYTHVKNRLSQRLDSRGHRLLLKPQRDSKLGPVSKECILVGYSWNTKGYRVYDPDDDKIYNTVWEFKLFYAPIDRSVFVGFWFSLNNSASLDATKLKQAPFEAHGPGASNHSNFIIVGPTVREISPFWQRIAILELVEFSKDI